MNKHERDSIRKYDSIAGYYDSTSDGRITAKFKQTILELCKVSDGDKVLDVGCGNGSLIGEICKMADVEGHGIDISPNMIEECRKRHSEVSFEASSGEELGFADGYFDVITICCVLHHLNDPKRFFSEARRVLRAGGVLIVGELWFPFPIKKFADYIVLPLLKAGDNRLFTHKRLLRLFTDNGFTVIDIYRKGFMQVVKAKRG